MTEIGDIYKRPAFGDHVMIIQANHYFNDVHQFRWLHLESGTYETYTYPHGDEIGDMYGGHAYIKVA